MTTIKLPLFDLKYNIIHKDLPHSHTIELVAGVFIYYLNAYIDELPKKEDGEYEVKAQQYFDSCTIIPKSQIGNVSTYFDNKHDIYVLEVKSPTDTVCPKFETADEANRVRKQIVQWLCEKD